jgi:hypothetical protein
MGGKIPAQCAWVLELGFASGHAPVADLSNFHLMPSEPSAQQSRGLVAQLRRAQIYRDYEQAFRETTGLPINLRPIEAFGLASKKWIPMQAALMGFSFGWFSKATGEILPSEL